MASKNKQAIKLLAKHSKELRKSDHRFYTEQIAHLRDIVEASDRRYAEVNKEQARALTSQLSANIYGNVIDHYLHHVLKVPFARYMDDIVVLGNDQSRLRHIKAEIERLGTDQLHLSISHWNIGKTSTGINFLGYRIWKNYKLLRRSSVIRAKRKIRKLVRNEDEEPLRRFLSSWLGHAQWADTTNLRRWMQCYIDNVENGIPK